MGLLLSLNHYLPRRSPIPLPHRHQINPFSKIINIHNAVFKVWVKRELLYCDAVSVGDGEGGIVLNTINDVDVGESRVGGEMKG